MVKRKCPFIDDEADCDSGCDSDEFDISCDEDLEDEATLPLSEEASGDSENSTNSWSSEEEFFNQAWEAFRPTLESTWQEREAARESARRREEKRKLETSREKPLLDLPSVRNDQGRGRAESDSEVRRGELEPLLDSSRGPQGRSTPPSPLGLSKREISKPKGRRLGLSGSQARELPSGSGPFKSHKIFDKRRRVPNLPYVRPTTVPISEGQETVHIDGSGTIIDGGFVPRSNFGVQPRLLSNEQKKNRRSTSVSSTADLLSRLTTLERLDTSLPTLPGGPDDS